MPESSQQREPSSQQFLGQQGQQAQQRRSLFETTWEELTHAGAYVEEGTGDLYRVPEEAFLQGNTPAISKVSKQNRRLIQVSDNYAVPINRARMVAANHNIEPNF
jgi:hypothetical protein